MGFVAQDDIISPLSTPYDALWFSLRTRRGTSRAETEERVQEMLNVLRLQHCRDTKVGIPGLESGLSGGERKRCSIGIELICDLKILLLDEPTSGLDSVTSAKVVHLLRQLSRTGRTVIYTIHQPTAEVLSYFDDVMLMTQGRIAYHGTMAASLDYFESIGFSCPSKYTPTDYYMVLLQDSVTSKVLIKRWRKYLKNGPRTPHTAAVRLAKSRGESSAARFLDAYIAKFGSSPAVQLYELTRRTMTEISRDYLYLFSYMAQAIFFAIVVGLIFIVFSCVHVDSAPSFFSILPLTLSVWAVWCGVSLDRCLSVLSVRCPLRITACASLSRYLHSYMSGKCTGSSTAPCGLAVMWWREVCRRALL
ncbi:putative ATP-binding cassette protein subfamily G,member 3 [Leishmania major strain Friedlin]|uniref:Putative ATP-binding cassette protein subfamily G,member 3 n=1 Tax=Leishmania major TaxID=5664 RepID=Q4QJ69_LEIMA|nr:putative ATP-binding cassette protein subfamily G,member 3 [Leishmania major strain Friedlin]CAG9568802.1 ATP-binding_cassette_protein_subfamily_G_-_member_1_-_putative;evidence=IEA;with=GeneDB:LmjF.06.0080;is_preferred=trueterm=ATP-binding_cassette_protein_subfamily_G_-_member_2_-_putative;evidence=IEA;with=GeneDB:LmjF.06.0090;rank=1term=ATP-binding_cassette_protein_subfamily_G_-_member_3_-_putative;evidence=IEA;with=GeneDB:LmjF.06.0100;rank=1 [Leishmania major strain Friedlin]CAJ02053.1 puta|eukprot:XP_001680779.1 putative ATP-binding cassette protein subfamily G,member 3 [Leishmania major strain Friedlin]